MKPDPDALPILLVEDDAAERMLLQRSLKRLGIRCRLFEASDGEAAIAYLDGRHPYADRARNPLPWLILLDLKMPKLGGFEVLTWIRNHDSLRTTPVLVLTGSDESADVARAYERGANAYLVKPMGPEALDALMRAISDCWLERTKLPSVG